MAGTGKDKMPLVIKQSIATHAARRLGKYFHRSHQLLRNFEKELQFSLL